MGHPDPTTSTVADGGGTQNTTRGVVTIDRDPSESELIDLLVPAWPIYEGPPCKIPWTFNTKVTMYLLQGKVKVSCEGYDESFKIRAGDLVVFPQGMKITWEVIKSVKTHYRC